MGKVPKDSLLTEKFQKILSELDHISIDEQKHKFEEMKELIYDAHEEELLSITTKRLFAKIGIMVEQKKLYLENAIPLLKCIGYIRISKRPCIIHSDFFPLFIIFEKIIIEEETKKEERNEKLLCDFCEYYLMLVEDSVSQKLLPICIRSALKVALNKEKDEETRKEVEMALLALSCINMAWIKAIIQYHQVHHNLTRLAYQSAWRFLINRLVGNERLGNEVVSKLHFAMEAARELVELSKCVDWKKKEECDDEAFIIKRWIDTLERFFLWFRFNEEKDFSGFIEYICQKCKESEKDFKETKIKFINIFRIMLLQNVADIDELLKGGAIELVLEIFSQMSLDDLTIWHCIIFFVKVKESFAEKGNGKTENNIKEIDAIKKKRKREIFDAYENEGFEEIMISFQQQLSGMMGARSDKGYQNYSMFLVNL